MWQLIIYSPHLCCTLGPSELGLKSDIYRSMPSARSTVARRWKLLTEGFNTSRYYAKMAEVPQ